MASGSRRSVFGRKSASHTIVIARGDKIRHWTVRPWLLATSLGLGRRTDWRDGVARLADWLKAEHAALEVAA